MAYKITDSCISCGTCKDACPVDAISEGADKYEIAEDACISLRFLCIGMSGRCN